jgi:hypothetical protein
MVGPNVDSRLFVENPAMTMAVRVSELSMLCSLTYPLHQYVFQG